MRRQRIRLRVAGKALHVDVAPILEAVRTRKDPRRDGSVAGARSRTRVRIAAAAARADGCAAARRSSRRGRRRRRARTGRWAAVAGRSRGGHNGRCCSESGKLRRFRLRSCRADRRSAAARRILLPGRRIGRRWRQFAAVRVDSWSGRRLELKLGRAVVAALLLLTAIERVAAGWPFRIERLSLLLLLLLLLLLRSGSCPSCLRAGQRRIVVVKMLLLLALLPWRRTGRRVIAGFRHGVVVTLRA